MRFSKKYYLSFFFLFSLFSLSAQVDPRTDKKDQNKNELESPSVIDDIKTPDRIEMSVIKLSDEETVIKEINTVKRETRQRNFKRKQAKGKGQGLLPGARNFKVRLQISNNNSYPMWYLMPFRGENKLPATGVFEADKALQTEMLRVLHYQGKLPDTYLNELQFTGKEKSHFRAFYIPAGGTMLLSNFSIDCWQDSETVEFWAVKELTVNNSEGLDKKVSYQLLSSQNTEIFCSGEKGCNPAVIEKEKIGISVADVNFIRANKVSKYKVKLSR